MNRRKWLLGVASFLIVVAAVLTWQRCAVATFLVTLDSNTLTAAAKKPGLDFGAPCNGSYPLIKAVRAGDEHTVRFLIRNKVNLNVRDELGGTPLIWAAEKDEPEIAAQLVAAGAELNTTDNLGATALRHAAR